jgi:hypothetical protein
MTAPRADLRRHRPPSWQRITEIFYSVPVFLALRVIPVARIKYAIRLPANQVLQGKIGYLLKRPVGRPKSGASMPISAIRPQPGPSRAG